MNHVVSRFGLSERRACMIVNLNRSTSQYEPMPRNDEKKLRGRMKELAYTHKRYGSPRLHLLLKREGLVINHKRTERLYREEGLSLRKRRRRKRLTLPRVPMPAASRANEVWSIDFLSDALAEGRRFRILAIVDDFTRVSPGILVRTSIPARKVTMFLDQICSISGYPERIRVDNGPEFTSAVFHQWAAVRTIIIEHIRPGKPSDNAFAESFIGKLRDECLNEHWFLNLAHAQQEIEAWRETYNTKRPHSSLNNLTPYEFIKEQTIPLQEEGLNLKLAHRMG
jgi:putative transposase